MATVMLDITMSLDGYITGPDDDPENGLGLRGGEHLHDWLFTGDTPSRLNPDFKSDARSLEVFEELFGRTGAAVVGRRMFELAGRWGGEFPMKGFPVFVVTHEPPADFGGTTTFRFVTDGIESAIEQAKAAAGDKIVYVGGGASIAQQALNAGLVDEIQIHIAPVLLGAGRRLFDNVAPDEAIWLEQERVLDAPGIAHIRYRIPTR
jgi:dihydrofolate reductase